MQTTQSGVNLTPDELHPYRGLIAAHFKDTPTQPRVAQCYYIKVTTRKNEELIIPDFVQPELVAKFSEYTDGHVYFAESPRLSYGRVTAASLPEDEIKSSSYHVGYVGWIEEYGSTHSDVKYRNFESAEKALGYLTRLYGRHPVEAVSWLEREIQLQLSLKTRYIYAFLLAGIQHPRFSAQEAHLGSGHSGSYSVFHGNEFHCSFKDKSEAEAYVAMHNLVRLAVGLSEPPKPEPEPEQVFEGAPSTSSEEP